MVNVDKQHGTGDVRHDERHRTPQLRGFNQSNYEAMHTHTHDSKIRQLLVLLKSIASTKDAPYGSIPLATDVVAEYGASTRILRCVRTQSHIRGTKNVAATEQYKDHHELT